MRESSSSSHTNHAPAKEGERRNVQEGNSRIRGRLAGVGGRGSGRQGQQARQEAGRPRREEKERRRTLRREQGRRTESWRELKRVEGEPKGESETEGSFAVANRPPESRRPPLAIWKYPVIWRTFHQS
ncbi:hypothetical protein EUGRSUZ_E03968 [Eucalyptus grandis]|uniref:Uncharacterized protein n=2 Tax=Eucalyptus grandis TaxID=71139 RepID=A0ACC3L103_EUCGR|nr:hypothetical protein EUGRSUZ_E03968 [Eucalyptus grandis]